MMRVSLLGLRALGLAALCFLVIGCASGFVRSRAPLTWTVENLHRDIDANAGEVRWRYLVVIDNPGYQAATLFRQSIIGSWDGVSLAADINDVNHSIAPRGKTRLPYVTVFRLKDYEAGNPGDPGRPQGSALTTERMRISWQYLGRYEDGQAIILNAEFSPSERM